MAVEEEDENVLKFMRLALAEARHALARLEVPVGCIIVHKGEVIACGSTNETRNVGCILYDNPNDKFELEIELIKAAQRCAGGRGAQFYCVVHSKNDGFGEKLTDAKFRQMIAMRYGAIPVARQVNGIMSSVIDVEDPQVDKSQATGFSFSSVEATDVVVALARALNYLKRNHGRWTNLIKNCMTKDLSWDANCVEAYEGAYNSIVPL